MLNSTTVQFSRYRDYDVTRYTRRSYLLVTSLSVLPYKEGHDLSPTLYATSTRGPAHWMIITNGFVVFAQLKRAAIVVFNILAVTFIRPSQEGYLGFKCWAGQYETSNQATTASFHIISNSLNTTAQNLLGPVSTVFLQNLTNPVELCYSN